MLRGSREDSFPRTDVLASLKVEILQEVTALQNEIEAGLIPDLRQNEKLRESIHRFHKQTQLAQVVRELEWMMAKLDSLMYPTKRLISALEGSSSELGPWPDKLEGLITQIGEEFQRQGQLKSRLLSWPRVPVLTPVGETDERAIEKLIQAMRSDVAGADTRVGSFLELHRDCLVDILPSWAERFMTLLGGLERNLKCLPA
jgi:hypothetical protein